MSESALVAAIRPNAYGSSTIGVKKSTVWTIARSSVSCTTPASSAVSVATSTRGSTGRGSPATIGRRSAAESLQPQPAPWEREARGGALGALGGPAVPQYPDAQIEAAIESLNEPGRLEQAQRVVAAAAPQLQD